MQGDSTVVGDFAISKQSNRNVVLNLVTFDLRNTEPQIDAYDMCQ